MEFWPQARSLTLTSRYLRHGAQHHDLEQIVIACCFRTRISFPHVCNQNSLGPTALRVGRRARFSLGGNPNWPVYQPLAFFIWWFKFDAYAPKIFMEGAGIAASGGIAAMGVALFLSVWRAKEAQHVTPI